MDSSDAGDGEGRTQHNPVLILGVKCNFNSLWDMVWHSFEFNSVGCLNIVWCGGLGLQCLEGIQPQQKQQNNSPKTKNVPKEMTNP